MKPLKAYDVVIEDTLEEAIEVTNVAIKYGYVPIGGIRTIENKFLQTIHLKPKQKMKGFFLQLMEIMVEGQEITLKTTKQGDVLVVLVEGKTAKGKALFQASGTPEEIEAEFIPAFVNAHEHKGFTSQLIESASSTKEDEEEEEEEGKDDAGKAETKKEPKAAAKKTAAKKAETKKEEKPVKEETSAVEELPQCNPPEATEGVDVKAEVANKQRVFNDCMEKGHIAFKEKRYDDAVREFKSALDIFPDEKKAQEQVKLSESWAKAVKEL